MSITDILEGSTKPSPGLCKAMLDQLKVFAIDGELSRIGLTPSVNTIAFKKALLVKHWCEEDEHETIERTPKPRTAALIKKETLLKSQEVVAEQESIGKTSSKKPVTQHNPTTQAKKPATKPGPSRPQQIEDSPIDLIVKKLEERILSLERKINSLELIEQENQEHINRVEKVTKDQQKLVLSQQTSIDQLQEKVACQKEALEKFETKTAEVTALSEHPAPAAEEILPPQARRAPPTNTAPSAFREMHLPNTVSPHIRTLVNTDSTSLPDVRLPTTLSPHARTNGLPNIPTTAMHETQRQTNPRRETYIFRHQARGTSSQKVDQLPQARQNVSSSMTTKWINSTEDYSPGPSTLKRISQPHLGNYTLPTRAIYKTPSADAALVPLCSTLEKMISSTDHETTSPARRL